MIKLINGNGEILADVQGDRVKISEVGKSACLKVNNVISVTAQNALFGGRHRILLGEAGYGQAFILSVYESYMRAHTDWKWVEDNANTTRISK